MGVLLEAPVWIRAFDTIASVGVTLIWAVAIVWLTAGLAWGRITAYRLTGRHLEIRFVGFPVRRVALSDITGVEQFNLGPGRFRCLAQHLTAVALPWTSGGLLTTEPWLSRLCGTGLLVRRQRGRQVAITPPDPEQFLAELQAATGPAK